LELDKNLNKPIINVIKRTEKTVLVKYHRFKWGGGFDPTIGSTGLNGGGAVKVGRGSAKPDIYVMTLDNCIKEVDRHFSGPSLVYTYLAIA